MGKKWLPALLLSICIVTGYEVTVGNSRADTRETGAAEIVLEGGVRGEVPFPHRRHQQALEEDCQICHKMFPREKGSIDALKAAGKLEPKDVMNKLCTSCHRQYRREGVDAGPITCSQCHQRKR